MALKPLTEEKHKYDIELLGRDGLVKRTIWSNGVHAVLHNVGRHVRTMQWGLESDINNCEAIIIKKNRKDPYWKDETNER